MTSYRILVLVSQGDERSSRIAGRLALGRPAVSAAVDALAEKGLLTRSVDERDRRAVKLELTKAGRKALQDADAAVAEHLRPLIDRLEDPAAVSALVDDITRAWNAISLERARSGR